MTAKTRVRQPLVRNVELSDGEIVEAPYDLTCGGCRSPWVPLIDKYLGEGLAFSAIHSLLGGRTPACPNNEHLRRHIAHLPEHQRNMRMQVEDPGRSLIGTEEAIAEVVAQGYRLMAAGQMEITTTDWMKALSLQAKLNKDAAQVATVEQYQSAFMSFFDILRRHLAPDEWRAFQRECMMSPEIRAVSNMGALT